MVTPNDAARDNPRIRVQELVTRADATRGAVLRARVIGRLGPYLVYRFVILILAAVTAWILAVRDALVGDGALEGPLLLGLLALGLTVIIVLIAYESVVGQPVRAVATDLNAMSGRVAAADLDHFEIAADGDRADLRAVRRDGRRVDVALGIDPDDARVLVSLIESVLVLERAAIRWSSGEERGADDATRRAKRPTAGTQPGRGPRGSRADPSSSKR